MLGLYNHDGAFVCDDEKSKQIGRIATAVSDYLELDNDGWSITQWNDADDRTQEEVIQALRDAAIKNQPDSMWG